MFFLFFSEGGWGNDNGAIESVFSCDVDYQKTCLFDEIISVVQLVNRAPLFARAIRSLIFLFRERGKLKRYIHVYTFEGGFERREGIRGTLAYTVFHELQF